MRSLEWKGSALALSWSPDGRHIAVGDQDGTVHFRTLGLERDLQMSGYPTKVRELAWDPGSRWLATGGSPVVTVWDTSGRGPEGSRPLQLEGHDGFLGALAWQRQRPCLASGCRGGRVTIWNPTDSCRPVSSLEMGAAIRTLAWSPDDRMLAIGAGDGSVVLAAP